MIDDSADADEAIRRVGQLLGVDELGSRVVLDLQFKKTHPGPASGHRFPCRRT